MDRIDEIVRRRKRAHARLLELGSPVYQAFLAMEQAAFRDGALPRKVKEHIAVGISVRADCGSCMQWRVEQAAAAGASREAALESVEVAIEMGGGAGHASARFALEAMDRASS